MAGFTKLTGKIAVLNPDTIDTDRIIPARYLSRVSKSGFGELLFKDVRTEGFVLDTVEAKGSSILVVGSNFGCGSSREHAVWALQQAGFVAIIAKIEPNLPGYSDIFRQNAANCGLLLIEIPPDDHAKVVSVGTGNTVAIDLPAQLVETQSEKIHFEINQPTKQALILGLDLIGTTLEFESKISEYENASTDFVPAGASK